MYLVPWLAANKHMLPGGQRMYLPVVLYTKGQAFYNVLAASCAVPHVHLVKVPEGSRPAAPVSRRLNWRIILQKYMTWTVQTL
jgi:hypothetical protein